MAQKTHDDGRNRATDPKFYLTAGLTPPFNESRIERLWAALFNHGVEPPE